ncbi:MAG TPA: hypothetical protein DCL21_02255 [Alphaproteobacteria bacterium]|nr:hypothetical protein [Alphaproteobacteria bacterium]
MDIIQEQSLEDSLKEINPENTLTLLNSYELKRTKALKLALAFSAQHYIFNAKTKSIFQGHSHGYSYNYYQDLERYLKGKKSDSFKYRIEHLISEAYETDRYKPEEIISFKLMVLVISLEYNLDSPFSIIDTIDEASTPVKQYNSFKYIFSESKKKLSSGNIITPQSISKLLYKYLNLFGTIPH